MANAATKSAATTKTNLVRFHRPVRKLWESAVVPRRARLLRLREDVKHGRQWSERFHLCGYVFHEPTQVSLVPFRNGVRAFMAGFAQGPVTQSYVYGEVKPVRAVRTRGRRIPVCW